MYTYIYICKSTCIVLIHEDIYTYCQLGQSGFHIIKFAQVSQDFCTRIYMSMNIVIYVYIIMYIYIHI